MPRFDLGFLDRVQAELSDWVIDLLRLEDIVGACLEQGGIGLQVFHDLRHIK